MIRFSFFAFIRLMLIVSALTAFATNARADLVEVETDTPLRKVYLFENKDAADIRLEVYFIAGEADWNGAAGLSHYLEHLMFWHANKAVSGDDVHGRRGNAWVNGYVTNYHSSAQKNLQDQVFDFGRALLEPPNLDPKFMLDEQEILVREYDLSLQDNPNYRVFDAVKEKLFGKNPAGRSVIGTPQSIRALTIEDAWNFHAAFYHPANMVLIVSGAISAGEVKSEIEQRFSGLDAGVVNAQNWRKEVVSGAISEEAEYRDQYIAFDALQYQSLLNWTLGGQKIEDIYVFEFAKAYLNSAVPGSPAKALRTEEFVFSGYDFWLDPVLDGQALFVFQGRLDKNVEHKAAAQALRKTLERISGEGISEASLERLRKRFIKEAKRRSDEPQFAMERAAGFLSLGLEPNSNADAIIRLENVTKAQVDGFLKSLANPERQIMTLMVSESK